MGCNEIFATSLSTFLFMPPTNYDMFFEENQEVLFYIGFKRENELS